jgi:hypothetical protein
MNWGKEELWNKSCVFFQRAYALEMNDDSFPLWLLQGFELLSRAALASTHPALLADPQNGENILYAFGYPSKNHPKSIPFKTVFHRLTVIVESITESDFKFSTSLMQARNAELHSGELAFQAYPINAWYPQFLKLIKKLTDHLGKNLDDLLGEEDAKAAVQVIDGFDEKAISRSKELIAKSKSEFEKLPLEQRLAREKRAAKEYIKDYDWKSKTIKCPSCGAKAVVVGEVLKYLSPTVGEEEIEERAVVRPKSLICRCCELSMEGYDLVYHAGFGEHYTETNFVNPKDYYGIEFDPSEYFEGDYGND